MSSMKHLSLCTTLHNYKMMNIYSTRESTKQWAYTTQGTYKPFTSSQIICSHNCQFEYKVGREYSRQQEIKVVQHTRQSANESAAAAMANRVRNRTAGGQANTTSAKKSSTYST